MTSTLQPKSQPGAPQTHEAPTYESVQQSEEFAQLRHRFRRFVFPMTGLFLGWYFAYVLLATYAHGFMATKVVGNINVALVMGLLQFVSTFTITMLYARWSAKSMDPAADALCQHLEEGIAK